MPKWKHYSKKSSRKQTDRLFQHRLEVYEWTLTRELAYRIGELTWECIQAIGKIVMAPPPTLWDQFFRDAMLYHEGGFFELPAFYKSVSPCAQCGQAPCVCPCGTTEDE